MFFKLLNNKKMI